MATGIVTPEMRRNAEALAEYILLMPRGRSKINGQGFYIIPFSEKPLTVAHYASDLGCTCEGFLRRGLCTHQIACTIVLQRQTAAMLSAKHPAPKSAQERYAEAGPFGLCISKGCTDPAVGKMRRCGAHFDALLESLAA